MSKRLVFNTLEELVSSDLNRSQAFTAQTLAAALRAMLLDSTTEATSSGTETVTSGTSTPLACVIFSGLRAVADEAGTSLYVTPGVALVSATLAGDTPDGGDVKLVEDAGIIVAGTLTLTAGDAVLTRIDVVEFALESEVVEDVDNRNVYDQITKQFVPSDVVKVASMGFTWRIRTGIAGAGYPGNVSGWRPVCVVKVPALAATWSDCTLWDVRPLASDLSQLGNVAASYERQARAQGRLGYETAVAHLRGLFLARCGARDVGGELDAQIDTADFQEPGFAAAIHGLYYAWAIFPYDLPRWCQYDATSNPRQPGKFRGIVVLSTVYPEHATGIASASIAPPTSLGLGGTHAASVLIAAVKYDATPEPVTMIMDGKRTWLTGLLTALDYQAPGGGSNADALFVLDKSNCPPNATQVRIHTKGGYRFDPNASYYGAVKLETIVTDVVAAGAAAGDELVRTTEKRGLVAIATGLLGFGEDLYQQWLPLPSNPNVTGDVERTIEIKASTSMTGGTPHADNGTDLFYVIGWELGP